MRSVAIVDTSIFCNVLNIPNMNGEREQVNLSLLMSRQLPKSPFSKKINFPVIRLCRL